MSVGVALAALAVAGVSYAAAERGSPQLVVKQANGAGSVPVLGGSAVPTVCPTPVSAGNSCVMTDSPGSPVILRPCPHLPNAGVASGECGGFDYLADGTQVTMRCWQDTSPPPDDPHKSPRWFYVNEVNGPHPGWSGYVYSVLVVQQVPTPACTDAITAQYDYPPYQPLPPVHFQVVGSCTTAGGTLTAVSSGFTPGAQFSISATYPDGTSYPLTYTGGTVRADGSVPWRWPCAGDPPGTYYTYVTDLSNTNTASAAFTIGVAPTPGGTSPPPSPTPRPTSPPPPPPPHTLDADATPAFGTCPSNPPPANEKYCGGWSNSCASPAFSQANCPIYVSQGTAVDAVCWTTGQTIYNNYSAAAPGPNWTLESDVWIKVSNYPSDPWMNELWFNPDNTAPNGLPRC